MFKTEPQQIDFPDVAPYRVAAEHHCPAPARTVFEVLKDNPGGANWLGWYVTSVESTSNPEHGLGSTRAVNWLFGIGRLEERFIGWEEPNLWSFTLTAVRPRLFSKFVERIRIEPIDDENCLIVYRLGVDFTPVGRPFARGLIAWTNRAIGPTLERMSAAALQRRR